MNKKYNVRLYAYKIIYQVKYQKGYSNLLLRKYLSLFNNSDKALLTNIVYGVLKNDLLLDYQLSFMKDIKLSNKQRTILYIALYQFHFLDKIPQYAILDEANKMSLKILDNYQKKFINMILHQLLNKELVYASTNDELLNISINYSHPLWLIKMLNKQYSYEQMQAIVEDNLKPSLTYLRVNQLKKDKFINNNNFNKINDFLYYYTGHDISKDANYLNGIVSIQDRAAQQVASLLNPLDNSIVLDMCAAPGTKTCHLAEIMHDTGLIKAVDIYEHRITLINNEIKRLNLHNIKTLCFDSIKLLDIEKENSFDYILLDAPCTGLGVIKRKPEIKYQDISTSMDEIILIQKELLKVAYKLLKPGGYLVYSTCTLNKKENEFQINNLLNEYQDLIKISEQTIFNYTNNSDGFYMCKLQKIL